jgi:hypothetical protein
MTTCTQTPQVEQTYLNDQWMEQVGYIWPVLQVVVQCF